MGIPLSTAKFHRMSIKLFHELNRAAECEDEEALAIFRALSKQLKDGGLTWIDVPEKMTGKSAKSAKSPKRNSRTIHRTEDARNNIGPVLLLLRNKLRFQDKDTPDVTPEAWKWREVESQWLNDCKLTPSQARELAEATELNNLEDYVGRAKPEWITDHKKSVAKISDEETREVRNCLVELQSTRSKIHSRSRKVMADFATAANSDRRRMVCWGTIVEIIGDEPASRDMQTLLAATQQSGETPESMALCVLLDIPPAKLNIAAPSLSTARAWLSQDQVTSMEEFLDMHAVSELDAAFETHKANQRVVACMIALSELDAG